MNFKLVFRLLGRLLLIEAILMIPSLAVALICGQGDAMAFLISMGITALAGAPGAFLLKPSRKNLNARDGLAVAGLSWAALSIFGSLPFLFSGAIPHFADALFETVSGFTTTGATILSDIEALPKGILFWRSFTHWIGGMGVLVFTLAILPKLSGRTSHMIRAESAGPTFSKLLPRMGDTAKVLYVLYFVLSFVMFLTLLLAGMNGYDAMIHTFSTAGTGGFSNYNASVGAFNSAAIEWIIAIFMMLFGVNFAIYFHLLRKEWKPVARNEEFWSYLGLVLVATLGITFVILPEYGFAEGVRHAFFQVASIMSTTGFASADFNLWPLFARTLLVLLIFVGACAGSTAGGFKVSRIVMLVKSGFRELQHTLQPRKVAVVRLDGKSMQETTLASLGVYLFMYIVLLIISILCLTFETTDLVTAFTASITCLSNVGPGLNQVGPVENFGFFSAPAKFFLSFIMLAGRLEIYPVLVLFAPSMWKKN